ncbi:MAG: serine/threonine protein kinase [Bradymonadia bacterium]
MHKITLRFDAQTEAKFRLNDADRVRSQSRIALVAGGMLYAVFGILDHWLVPAVAPDLWVIRYGVVCPLMALFFFCTFADRLKQKVQFLLAVTAIVGGAGIVAMLTLAPAPASYLYYAGLLLVVIYTFAFLGLRFVYGLVMSFLLLILYVCSLPYQEGLTTAVIVNNLFFLTTTIFLSATAGYAAEKNNRRAYLDRVELESLNLVYTEQNQSLALLNAELEEKHGELALNNRALGEANRALADSMERVQLIFAALSDALPGTILEDRYRLDEKIGTGGFGTVYRATDLENKQTVAVKVLKPSTLGEPVKALERLRIEGISGLKIKHPNCTEVLDFGIASGQIAFLVMTYLSGNDLTAVLHHCGRLNAEIVLKILQGVIRGLEAAHAQGVIHRDIKPSNIFLHTDGHAVTPVLLDFGIAKLIEGTHPLGGVTVTEAGGLVGTPIYMAPEQVLGEPIDTAVDIFSFGLIAYELLSGLRPWASDGEDFSWSAILRRADSMPIELMSLNESIPPTLSQVVMACLARAPDERPTAAELVDFLETLNLDAFDEYELPSGLVAHEADGTRPLHPLLTKTLQLSP